MVGTLALRPRSYYTIAACAQIALLEQASVGPEFDHLGDRARNYDDRTALATGIAMEGST